MADQFAEAFRRYWAVIVTVVGATVTMFAAIYTVTMPLHQGLSDIKADVRELRTLATGNFSRHEESRLRTEREFERVWEHLRRDAIKGNPNDR